MSIYNVSKIENWLKDFTSAKDKYTNDYYKSYKNSYIRTCNDSTIIKMRNKLNSHYQKISNINSRIKTFWDDYLWDLKVIDNRLAGGKGSVNDSTISSKLSKLPTLKQYEADLSVKINSASAVVGTVDAIGWSENKTLEENLKDSAQILGSSAAVVGTTIISGIAKLNEKIYDGILLLGTQAVTGVATLVGEEEWAESAQNTMMDFISYDFTKQGSKAFYEYTNLGRTINDKSLIKYDSEVANTIQNTTTFIGEFAAATALTVATGGTAAPVAAAILLGTGYLMKSGEKAEEKFSEQDRDFWGDSVETTVSGVIGAIEFYSKGKMGQSAIKGISAIKSSGGVINFMKNAKSMISTGKSNLFTKESLKKGITSVLKDEDTYLDSVGAAFNNITYDNKNGLKINWEGLAKETACNFTLNTAFGFIGNSLETKMADGIKNMEINVNSSKSTVKSLNDNKTDLLKKEYEELLSWKNSEKFNKDQAYWQSFGNRIGGNNYKKNMDRLAELENIFSNNKQAINVSSISSGNNSNLNNLSKEYNDLLNKSKESWFLKAKEARDNGWAWDLNEVTEVDNIVKRMGELEQSLNINKSAIPESKIYDYSQAKKEADELVKKISQQPIPALEKYKVDTNSEEYKKAMQELYKNPSPSGKQILSQSDNLIKNTYRSFQTNNGIGINILRKNNVLTLAPLGVTEIDGKIIYISLYNGKTIYSGTDVISQFLNGDESIRKSIVENFLNESRINKYLMTTDGYIGHFEIENGVMQKKIYNNFELKINEKANSYATYLDDVRNFNNKADFGADQHTASNYISAIDAKGVHVYDTNLQSVKNTINSLKGKYNIDTNSVCNIIYNMDGNGSGACSYASRANAIFSKYRGKEAEFMRDFGYPMYEKINGQIALNSRTLVTDLYISSNLDRNIPGKISLFKTGDNGKIEINPNFSDGKFRRKNQVYMSSRGGINDDDMNLFFRRNGLSITHNSNPTSLNAIKGELLKNNQVHLGIYQNVNAPITLHNMDGGKDVITTTWNEGGGHALQVVGIQGDNIIVSSWGSKYSINIGDLKSNNYVVYATSIK